MKRVLQTARWIGLVLFGLMTSASGSECAADQIVMRGTATVATIYDDFEYEGTVRRLPLAATVGDKFTFFLNVQSRRPAPDQQTGFGPSGSATFHATVGGAQLQHQLLWVLISNDWGVDQLSLADPAFIDASAIVGDRILIQNPYQFRELDFAGTTNVVGAPPFRLNLGFLEYVMRNPLGGSPQNYPAILHDLTIPQDVSTWQAFSHRELGILYENSTFVGAHINDLVAIPEPSALSICGWCCLFCLGRQFAGRRPKRIPSIGLRRNHAASPS